jgi:hypothetical protein
VPSEFQKAVLAFQFQHSDRFLRRIARRLAEHLRCVGEVRVPLLALSVKHILRCGHSRKIIIRRPGNRRVRQPDALGLRFVEHVKEECDTQAGQ